MKKKLIFSVLILSCLLLVGCSCGKKEEKPEEEEVKLTIGDSVEVDNFKVEVLNYSIRPAIKENEKHQTLVFVEVNVTNNASKSDKFSQSLFTPYGPNDTKLDKITLNSYTTLVYNMDATRAGGTTNGHLAFPFAGYGEYKLEFGSSKSNKTIYFTIFEN